MEKYTLRTNLLEILKQLAYTVSTLVYFNVDNSFQDSRQAIISYLADLQPKRLTVKCSLPIKGTVSVLYLLNLDYSHSLFFKVPSEEIDNSSWIKATQMSLVIKIPVSVVKSAQEEYSDVNIL